MPLAQVAGTFSEMSTPGEGIFHSDISIAMQNSVPHTEHNPPRKRKYRLYTAAHSDSTRVLLLPLEAVM